MIIWINGGFGAGKTTLAEELRRRLPGAVLFDSEYVGYILREWVPVPTGDFQDLPSWRELVIETALALRRHHAQTLIVPMSLLNDDYARQILGGLTERGEQILHSFLDLDAEVLGQRITERVMWPDHPEREVVVLATQLASCCWTHHHAKPDERSPFRVPVTGRLKLGEPSVIMDIRAA